MKKIELVTGIKSSILGFGCAPILGSVGAVKSRKAIACALDCGINHFDVARSYGYGEAEGFLGKALLGNRLNVVIASKFGIKANAKAKFLAPIKPLVRYLKQTLKSSKGIRPQPIVATTLNVADKFHYRISFNENEMVKSLHESLKALKTDYLDYFFIHEPLHTLKNIDELCNAVIKLKRSGKIRAWGIAYMHEQAHLHQSYFDVFDVLQFSNSSNQAEYNSNVLVRGEASNIIFSPLRGSNKELSVEEKFQKLHHDFPNTVMLCSMYNVNHIKSNSKLFSI
ncbi:MAG: aldo/keto reductase [Flavobacterium sp.]|nr:aldo/keto reductase [Flavobacterium sp.]